MGIYSFTEVLQKIYKNVKETLCRRKQNVLLKFFERNLSLNYQRPVCLTKHFDFSDGENFENLCF